MTSTAPALSPRPSRTAGPSAPERLLAAAAAALVDNDGALEMADVARRAGVSTGLAYHHFGSKAGLLGAVIEDFYDRYDAVANQAFPRTLSWAARERRRTSDVVGFLFDDPLAEIILTRMSGAPEAAAVGARRLAALVEKGARNIASGQKSGEIPADIDPELASAFVLGGITQSVVRALARAPRPPVAPVAEAAWRFIANTVSLKEPRP